MLPSQEWIKLTNAITDNPVYVHLPLITVMTSAIEIEKMHAPGARTIVHFQDVKIAVRESIDDVLKEIDLRR